MAINRRILNENKYILILAKENTVSLTGTIFKAAIRKCSSSNRKVVNVWLCLWSEMQYLRRTFEVCHSRIFKENWIGWNRDWTKLNKPTHHRRKANNTVLRYFQLNLRYNLFKNKRIDNLIENLKIYIKKYIKNMYRVMY